MKYGIINLLCLFIVVYVNQACWYWIDDEEPDKLNPCGVDEIWVPESALRVDYD